MAPVQLLELPSWVTLLTTFVILLLFSRRLRRRKYNLPPGPKPWPIIGNLNLMGSLPHQSFHGLTQKYGPIMHIWLGSKPVIVGSSAKIAKEFLKTHDATLAGRPKFSAGYVKRMKALGKKFDWFMEHVLEEHIEKRKNAKDYVAKDMVDVLLQLAEDPNLEVKLERPGVKGFTQVN
ncbi:flavonoid 3'-hydroxylase, partial [Trifolium pratense]